MPDKENDDLTQTTQRYAEGAEKTERDWIESFPPTRASRDLLLAGRKAGRRRKAAVAFTAAQRSESVAGPLAFLLGALCVPLRSLRDVVRDRQRTVDHRTLGI